MRIIKHPDVRIPASNGGMWTEYFPCYNERIEAMGHPGSLRMAFLFADKLELI